MRIALDLQACQTGSRHRGIGRYSLSLSKAILQSQRSVDEIFIGLDGTYAEAANEVAFALRGRLPSSAISRYAYPSPNCAHGTIGDVLRPAAQAMVRHHYAALAPDVIHVNSLFEGFVEHAAGLSGVCGIPGVISSTTLYDFIPLIFATPYLERAQYAAWYSKRLATLHRFDLLLCISQATKRDAMRLLGLADERLFVIDAGVDPKFSPRQLSEQRRAELAHRYHIRKRFILYTGNGDFRKNLDGAVEAFAAVPQPLRKDVQLVLNQVGDEIALRETARRAGLSKSDIVITGAIDDDDLIDLFRSCELFFFPSLYEGFGLPVLEAMACGAPSLVANNSSLSEVMDIPDALFDARRIDEIAQKLVHGLSDADFRRSLSQYGQARASKFTWEASARSALSAWETVADRKRSIDSTIVVARGQRLKIAMFTPLLPEKTGIANYVAELLLPLSRYFDIDLYTTAEIDATGLLQQQFAIHPWQKFESNPQRYDHVVYQIGNSPFHSHMVDMVRRFPGLVVLHDFFLSSMFAYMDEHQGHVGLFKHELQYSHGRGAVDYLNSHSLGEAKNRYPLSRSIIENASGIVVHSQHSFDLCKAFFPHIKRGPWTQIPHIRIAMPETSHAARLQIRSRLGIAESDFLIASFGFLADTKLNHVLLEALAVAPLTHDAFIRLVFVGQNDGGEYGDLVLQKIAAHPLRERIQILGFASEANYSDYLHASDCAVQLRTRTRGETSGAVLDCMAHGLAVIVNDYGPFHELADEAVVKISAAAPADELAVQLARLKANSAERRLLGEKARALIARKHSPSAVAAHYETAIRNSVQMQMMRSGETLERDLTDIFMESTNIGKAMNSIGTALARDQSGRAPVQLYVDLSEVVKTDYGTGIHRVVRNLARELLLKERPCIAMTTAVVHGADGSIHSADEFVVNQLSVPAALLPLSFAPRAGNIFLMLDSAWTEPERFVPTIKKIQQRGGEAAALVYDLVPIRFPQYCVAYMPEIFERWLRFVVQHCDYLICISRSTAEDLAHWIKESKIEPRARQRIEHIHLGSDLKEHQNEPPSADIVRAMAGGRTLLMVGTIEPRKRHDTALDAIEMAWRNGSDLCLVIIGKSGWNSESLIERIRSHAELGKRLFWFDAVQDKDLEHAYRTASLFLQASEAEGFGLPIVEAAQYGRPLLLSDIPVFREIAGSGAQFFPVGNSDKLCELLLASPQAHVAAAAVQTKSWSDCAEDLLEILNGRRMYGANF